MQVMHCNASSLKHENFKNVEAKLSFLCELVIVSVWVQLLAPLHIPFGPHIGGCPQFKKSCFETLNRSYFYYCFYHPLII